MSETMKKVMAIAKGQGIDFSEFMKDAMEEFQEQQKKKRFKVEVKINKEGYYRYRITVTDTETGIVRDNSTSRLEDIERQAKWTAQNILDEIEEDKKEKYAPKEFYFDAEEIKEK